MVGVLASAIVRGDCRGNATLASNHESRQVPTTNLSNHTTTFFNLESFQPALALDASANLSRSTPLTRPTTALLQLLLIAFIFFKLNSDVISEVEIVARCLSTTHVVKGVTSVVGVRLKRAQSGTDTTSLF